MVSAVRPPTSRKGREKWSTPTKLHAKIRRGKPRLYLPASRPKALSLPRMRNTGQMLELLRQIRMAISKFNQLGIEK